RLRRRPAAVGVEAGGAAAARPAGRPAGARRGNRRGVHSGVTGAGLLPRLSIGTQHPAFGGGVLALVRAFLDWVRLRPQLAPTLPCAALARGDPANVTPAGLLRGRLRPRARAETWEGVPAVCVGRLVPGVEALAACGGRRLWREVLAPFDAHQVVCG